LQRKDRSGEDCPQNIKPDLLAYLNTKTGEEATTVSLTGVTQRAVNLTISTHPSFSLTISTIWVI